MPSDGATSRSSDPIRARDLKTESEGDAARLEIIEDDGIQCLVQSRLDHRRLAQVDLGRDQGMNHHRFRPMMDAGQ